MSRDIPESVPDDIANLVYKNWGNVKAFSDSLADKLIDEDPEVLDGLDEEKFKAKFYITIHSLLCKSTQSVLEPIVSIAEKTKIPMGEICNVMLDPDLVKRREAVNMWRTKCGTTTDRDFAKEIGVSKGYIYHVVNGTLTGDRLRNVCLVANHLGVDLKRFYEYYNPALLAVS